MLPEAGEGLCLGGRIVPPPAGIDGKIDIENEVGDLRGGEGGVGSGDAKAGVAVLGCAQGHES